MPEAEEGLCSEVSAIRGLDSSPFSREPGDRHAGGTARAIAGRAPLPLCPPLLKAPVASAGSKASRVAPGGLHPTSRCIAIWVGVPADPVLKPRGD
jgi:hypothetical protein